MSKQVSKKTFFSLTEADEAEQELQTENLQAETQEEVSEKTESFSAPTNLSVQIEEELDNKVPVVAEQIFIANNVDNALWYILGGGLALGGIALAASGGGSSSGSTTSPSSTATDHHSSVNNDISTSSNKNILPPLENSSPAISSKSYRTFHYDNTFFKQDSDKDGLFDALDPNPTSWNVSERDLRSFSTLAYSDKDMLEKIFKHNQFNQWQKINQNKEKGFNLTFSEKEGKDFIQNWELLEFTNKNDLTESGLDYAVFGNGKKTDGSYENVVFAFRGSKRQLIAVKDYMNALVALDGGLPKQAQELENIVGTLMEKYRPSSVYATGHSLGGYLAQYFTSHIMPKSGYMDNIKHTAIFNPLRLMTSDGSPTELKQALQKTNEWIKTPFENADKTNNSQLYKTNSYVINGEFLSDGVSKTKTGFWGALAGTVLTIATGGGGLLLGALAGGASGILAGMAADEVLNIGSYENTVRFNSDTDGEFAKHKMIRFYESSPELAERFAFGSRRDDWFYKKQNPYLKDSDGDGIADVVENYFHSDANDPNSSLTLATLLNNQQITEKSTALLYQMSEQQIDFVSHSTTQLTEHIYGNALNNRIDGGQGNNVLFGGDGKDIFVLGTNQFKQGELNTIADFDSTKDKLDLKVLNTQMDKLSWNSEQLSYQDQGESYVLAKFLNPIELTEQNFII